MKRYILITAVLLLIVPLQAMASYILRGDCEDVSELARSVMLLRQSGTTTYVEAMVELDPLEENELEIYEAVTILIDDAYATPYMLSNEFKMLSIDMFQNKWYNLCLEGE